MSDTTKGVLLLLGVAALGTGTLALPLLVLARFGWTRSVPGWLVLTVVLAMATVFVLFVLALRQTGRGT